jgi:glucose-6-phosphate 1-dehydrogenase
VVLGVDTWRWAGVPFRLRSGKAIGAPRREVVVTFNDPPRLPTGLTGYRRSDRLRLGLAAHRLAFDLNVNDGGDPFTLEPVTLEGVYGRRAARLPGQPQCPTQVWISGRHRRAAHKLLCALDGQQARAQP